MKKGPQLGDKIMFNFHLKPPFFISGLWYFAFGQLLQFRIYLQTKNRSVWNKSAWRGDLNFLCKVGDFYIWTLFISSELQLKGYFWKGKDITKLASSENFSPVYSIFMVNEVVLGEGPRGKYAISRLNPEPYLHKICRVINFSVPNVLSQTVTHTLNYVQLHCPYAEMRDAYSQSDWRILFRSTMLLTG